MCTILTVSREFYLANRESVIKRVKSDFRGNNHGTSLLMIGADGDDSLLLRTMGVADALTLLDLKFLSGVADRAWIHLRFATTGYQGLNGCHGFAANDYTVFHNGILSRPESATFNVDSELIAADVVQGGKDHAIAALQASEQYANVFLVNNKTGTYTVVRQSTGSLYTDGQGNYSSNPVGTICQTVPPATVVEYATPLVVPPVVVRLTSAYNGSWARDEYLDDYVDLDRGYLAEVAAWVKDLTDLETFEWVASEERWDKYGVPVEYWDLFTSEQLSFARACGLQCERSAMSYG